MVAPRLDPSLAEMLHRVRRTFARAELPYVVLGQAALHAWGGPVPAGPAGLEVEVIAQLQPGDAEELVYGALAGGFRVDGDVATWAVERGDHVTLLAEGARYVDVKPARGLDDMAALRHRVALPLQPRWDQEPRRVWVAALEECLARRIAEGTSAALAEARQLLDLHTATLDRGFLERRCEELGVLHLLREVEQGPPMPTPT